MTYRSIVKDTSPLPALSKEELAVLEHVAKEIEAVAAEDPEARVILVACPHCEAMMHKTLMIDDYIHIEEAREQ
jgi:Fe-S oxidoreductase